jgi:hypothetical protein
MKIIAVLALIMSVLGGLWYYGNEKEDQGLKAGKALEQSLWDQDIQNREAAYAARMADLATQLAMTQAANETINDKHNQELIAYNDSVTHLAGLLRDAQSRASAYRAVSQAASVKGAATGTPAPSVGQIDDATGAALAECALVRSGYKALIAELLPQL